MTRLSQLGRTSSWSGVRALVTGLGRSGFAAADTLVQLGASVTVVDERDEGDIRDKAHLLRMLGGDVRLGETPDDVVADIAADVDVIVTSPGWRPDTPILASARVPVWSEVELAWRLRGDEAWLVVTGTNGKTTTVQMLEAMLTADGARAAAVGNVGRPVVEAIMDPQPYDVLAVELSSFQLHWTASVAADSAAVLNVAPDHLDWHGSYEDYTRAKGSAYQGCKTACVYNVQDPLTEDLVRAADVAAGCRAIGFTLDIPAPGTLGVVDGVLADRAFVPERSSSAAELARIEDLVSDAPHLVANALAAAALARSWGVSVRAVRDGLRRFTPDSHRITTVGQHGDVTWVDDSKATNTHAAGASLSAFPSVVWIAGGLAKGAQFDDVVRGAAGRLRGVVLIGRDRHVIADALRRHAPHVPTVTVETRHTDLMDDVVEAARDLAEPGDTVLLAPGCASMDQFVDYGARGDEFARSVRRVLDQ